MKILTWNVNSVKTRLERLIACLERHQPDIVCLQELKTVEEKFPFEAIREAGYHAAVYGQKTYNGVAILSKQEPQDIRRGIDDDVDDPQARLVSAQIGDVRVISVYFPNGSAVGSDKWEYKLHWMARLQALFERDYSAVQPLLVCGDTNIAIHDSDVANPDNWADSVLCAAPGREALQRILAWGLHDVFGRLHPDGGIYSWWDYRNLGFPKNDGLRIDHILATKTLADVCTEASVDRDERKGTKENKPSDHAPVIAVFS